MKKHTLGVAVLAVATFGWISVAAAQSPEGGRLRRQGGPGRAESGHNRPGRPPIGMIAEHLGLSDEQKSQWRAIHENERENAEPLRKAVGEAKQAFEKALESESPDAAAIGQAAIAMRNARRGLEARHQATFDAVKAILTPEQLAKVEEMEKHVRRPGPGGRGYDGPGLPRRPGVPGASR